MLRTVGRRSGQLRDAPVLFVRYGDGFVVVASNAASERSPAWWLNLQERPEAEVIVGGNVHKVRARRARPEESRELWPKIIERYSGYEHYKEMTSREIPVVVLETC